MKHHKKELILIQNKFIYFFVNEVFAFLIIVLILHQDLIVNAFYLSQNNRDNVGSIIQSSMMPNPFLKSRSRTQSSKISRLKEKMQN